jgi:hypothetical protein
MIVTVVAIMCKLVVAQATIVPDGDCTAEEARVEEIVTDTDKDDNLTWIGCHLGQAQIADWKGHHPIYHKDHWRIGRIKCVPGRYEIRGQA